MEFTSQPRKVYQHPDQNIQIARMPRMPPLSKTIPVASGWSYIFSVTEAKQEYPVHMWMGEYRKALTMGPELARRDSTNGRGLQYPAALSQIPELASTTALNDDAGANSGGFQ